MARKQKNSVLNLGFSYWDTKDYLRECPNMVRWNPRLAIDWMDAIAPMCVTDIQINEYNYAAKQMNSFLDFFETMRYYDKYAVWENDRVRRVELISDYDEASA
jgi:hypothetical protein